MSKMPIKWHEECLANRKKVHARYMCDVKEAQAIAIRMGVDNVHYENQINEAKRKKMDGFDRDRFMKKK